MKVKVKALMRYKDLDKDKIFDIGDEYTTSRKRGIQLSNRGVAEIIEIVKDTPKEDKKKPTKKVEKR